MLNAINQVKAFSFRTFLMIFFSNIIFILQTSRITFPAQLIKPHEINRLGNRNCNYVMSKYYVASSLLITKAG